MSTNGIVRKLREYRDSYPLPMNGRQLIREAIERLEEYEQVRLTLMKVMVDLAQLRGTVEGLLMRRSSADAADAPTTATKEPTDGE